MSMATQEKGLSIRGRGIMGALGTSDMTHSCGRNLPRSSAWLANKTVGKPEPLSSYPGQGRSQDFYGGGGCFCKNMASYCTCMIVAVHEQ